MRSFLLVLLIVFTFGCRGNLYYKNESHYSIVVGDEIKLYHSTNSCCHYCINENDLRHVNVVGDELIDSGPKDCDGCNTTRAFILRAISPGTDSVLLTLQTAPRSCGDSVFVSKSWFTVEVR